MKNRENQRVSQPPPEGFLLGFGKKKKRGFCTSKTVIQIAQRFSSREPKPSPAGDFYDVFIGWIPHVVGCEWFNDTEGKTIEVNGGF